MKPHRRLIVVTGITRGLGRALVNEFVERGHPVAGCGRRAEDLSQLREQFGGSNSCSQVDVTQWDEVQSWAAEVIARQGVPDLVINNAGIINRSDTLWRIAPREVQRVMDVNIMGTVHVIDAFLPAMIEKNRGIIANMSSGWGRSTAPEVAPYCASKWAIEGLTQALAQELPPGLAAVAVNPGIIDTEMLRSCWQDAAAGFPKPTEWAQRAATFFLKIGIDNNGSSLTVN